MVRIEIPFYLTRQIQLPNISQCSQRSTSSESATDQIAHPKDSEEKMVCLACLLPLFLVPIVNLLPVLFDYFMAKLYTLFGWEYRRPERAPPVCPMKPIEPKTTLDKSEVAGDPNLVPDPSIGVHEGKQD